MVDNRTRQGGEGREGRDLRGTSRDQIDREKEAPAHAQGDRRREQPCDRQVPFREDRKRETCPEETDHLAHPLTLECLPDDDLRERQRGGPSRTREFLRLLETASVPLVLVLFFLKRHPRTHNHNHHVRHSGPGSSRGTPRRRCVCISPIPYSFSSHTHSNQTPLHPIIQSPHQLHKHRSGYSMPATRSTSSRPSTPR
jgi:hypothetical protein